MGLIKALTNSVSTALGDQFKEFVNLPEVGTDVLIARGVVQHGKGNTNASEGVISNGSRIVIPEGWAMMLVDNGKVEFSSEPGEYTYDSGSEPSIFYGGLGKGILNTFKTIGSRFTFGGQTAKDQRVYYVNLLEVTGNKFGSTSPKEVYDYFYEMSIELTFRGNYTYRVDNPLALVQTVIGAHPKDRVTFAEVFGDQFKSDVNEQMHKALTQVMEEKKIRFSAIGGYGSDLSAALNSVLNEKWQNYGIIVTAISMEDIGATDEYKAIIKDVEGKTLETRMMGKTYSDNMQGTMAAATGEALKNASKNENGAMMGFAGFNLANQAGNTVLGAISGTENAAPAQEAASAEGGKAAGKAKFCPECGTKTEGAKFCPNCGKKL